MGRGVVLKRHEGTLQRSLAKSGSKTEPNHPGKVGTVSRVSAWPPLHPLRMRMKIP